MNRAAGIVQGGMSRVQSVAQAATYAVDDFFAAFSTGGVAGGLRGAGNNLTQIASLLGGIKVQLVVIAGLAAAQFLVKAFSGAEAGAKKLEEQINRVAEAQKRLRDLRESGISAVQDTFWEGAGQTRGEASRRLNEIRRNLSVSSDRMARLQADRDATASRYIPGTAEGNEEVASHFRKIRDEELKDLDSRIASESEVLNILQQQELAQTEVVRQAKEAEKAAKAASAQRQLLIDQQKLNQPFINRQERADMASELFRIDEELEKSRPRMSMADMFKLLPSANTMGSVGAISAISAAQIGPQNARDSGPALQRQSLQELRRIRELEERKKGLLEVVGL